jgi:hypothetical protein
MLEHYQRITASKRWSKERRKKPQCNSAALNCVGEFMLYGKRGSFDPAGLGSRSRLAFSPDSRKLTAFPSPAVIK